MSNVVIEELSNSVLSLLPETKTEDIVIAYILKKNDLYRGEYVQFESNTNQSGECSLFNSRNCKEAMKIIRDKVTQSSTGNFVTFDTLKENSNDASTKSFNAWLSQLPKKAPEDIAVEDFLGFMDELQLFRKKRKAVEYSLELINKVFSKTVSKRIDRQEAILSDHAQKVQNLISTNKGEFPILYSDEFSEIVESLITGSSAQQKISTGIHTLDGFLNFIRCTELVVIGARPGMGKTSLALNIFFNAIKNGVKSLYFSAEMPREEISKKVLNLIFDRNVEGVGLQNMGIDISEYEKEKIVDFTKQVYNSFSFVDKPFLSLEDIRRYVKDYNFNERVKAKRLGLSDEDTGVKIIFIDYLQILDCSSANPMANETDKIAKITKALKGLALELNLAVVLMSQLNRENTKQADKRPSLSQLKGSGAIEQDANKIILLHREHYYVANNQSVSDTFKEALEGVVEIIVDKNRGGQTGSCLLKWEGSTQKIDEFEFGDEDETAEKLVKYNKAITGEIQEMKPSNNNGQSSGWGNGATNGGFY